MKFSALRLTCALAALLAMCVVLFACATAPQSQPTLDVTAEQTAEPTAEQGDDLNSGAGSKYDAELSPAATNPSDSSNSGNEAPMPRPNVSAPPSTTAAAGEPSGADEEFIGEWHLIRGEFEGWFYETADPDAMYSGTLTFRADKTVTYSTSDSLLDTSHELTGTWVVDDSGRLPDPAQWLGYDGFEFKDGTYATWWITISGVFTNDAYAIYNGTDIELFSFFGEYPSREEMWTPGVSWDLYRREPTTPPPIAPVLGKYVNGAEETVAVFTWFNPSEDVLAEQGAPVAHAVPGGENTMLVIGVMNGIEVVVTRASNLYYDDFGDRHLYDETNVLWRSEFNRNETISVKLDNPADDPYYICLRKINGHRRWLAFTLGDEDWDSHEIFSLHLST